MFIVPFTTNVFAIFFLLGGELEKFNNLLFVTLVLNQLNPVLNI